MSIEKLQDELLTINSSIQRELEAEKRGSTRFSRLPGLYAEKSRIERQLAILQEPQDDALAIAKKIVDGNIGHDVIAIARAVREAVREAGQRAQGAVPHLLRYTNDGELAECPCCGSLDVGGAHDTVNCYGCGLQITKPRPLQNAVDAWNKRAMLAAAPALPAAHHIEQALDMVTPAQSEVQRLREALTQLLSYAERQICAHDNTHRGGAIWEICDDCGAKWADDEGGKPEFKWPNEIEAARAALAPSTGQEVGK